MLDDLRKKIDELDRQIVALLNQRAGVAQEIGAAKDREDAEIYVPSREKAVFSKIAELNEGPIRDDSMAAIYREIMSASLALERPLSIAYLGPQATFTHQAAKFRFGGSVHYTPCDSIEDVFAAVEKKQADYGVVPIENSIEGPVGPTLDCLVSTPVRICSEIMLPISQCLLALDPDADITRIYGHPQSLAQCRKWLATNYPGVEQMAVGSTTRAAELASKEEGAAAVCSGLAADIYGLRHVADGIQDHAGNTTRFFILAQKFGPATGRDRTSIIFSVKHEAGSLYGALESFREHNLNLTRIESRPSKARAWEYYFFIDVDGHVEDDHVGTAIEELKGHCVQMAVLGSYPRA